MHFENVVYALCYIFFSYQAISIYMTGSRLVNTSPLSQLMLRTAIQSVLILFITDNEARALKV